MTDDLDLAQYPMVSEAAATGVVAAVYADVLTRSPFVPSLYKSLALCPQYLVLAHEQAAADEALSSAAEQLVTGAGEVVLPPSDPAVRSTLGRYALPIGRMLLLAAGLGLALRGELDAPSAPGRVPPSRPVDSDPPPTVRSAPAPDAYGQIRTALGTPIVNTIWRGLSEQGQLGQAWSVLGPQVPSTRDAAGALQQRAVEVARGLPWPVAADQAALQRVGAPDAAAGMAAVLEAYLVTLARVLVLVASSADPAED